MGKAQSYTWIGFVSAFLSKGNNFCNFLFASLDDVPFNPIALRKAKIVYNFGLCECSRVKNEVYT